MYKIVFLLIFSAASATEGRVTMLDIYTKRDTITSPYNLMCVVIPHGTQKVLEGEKIKFNVQTRSHLKDFWCNNAYGSTVFNPFFDTTTINTQDNGKTQMWTISGDYSSYEKATMDGEWTCKFRIKKPHNIKINAPTIQISSDEYIEGSCELQFQITVPISLSITQLSDWTWISRNQGIKRYNYTFSEGEKTFDCALINPTELEETYTISFKLDGLLQKRQANVVIEPHGKFIVSDTFKLNSANRLINCTATNVKGIGPNLRNEIHLHYVPAPRVFLNMQTLYSPAPQILKFVTLFRENYTQLYDYYFMDGEKVTFNCALNNDEGYEKNYGLTLCIEGENCAKSEGEATSISVTFTLKSEDRYKKIQCTAYNKKSGSLVLPSYLYSIVNLHYTPREDTETAEPMLCITGPEKLLRSSDTIYHYNFTDGEIVELNCSLSNAGESEIYYDIVFFNYNKSTHQNDFVTSARVLKTSLYIYYNFTLKKEAKAIRCGAFSEKYDKQYSVDVYLHYLPQPTQDLLILNIEETSELEKEGLYPNDSTQLDSYEFTDNENITIIGALNITEENKATYDIEIYLNKKTQRQSKVRHYDHYRNGSSFKMDFTLRKENQNITCVVRKNKTPILNRVIKLIYKKKKTGGGQYWCWNWPPWRCPTPPVPSTITQPPQSASGMEIYMDGLPPNSCTATDAFKIYQICTYSFREHNRLGTTLPLKCVMHGTHRSKKSAQFKIQFETNGQTVTVVTNKFTTKNVSYEIPLKEENCTVKCTLNKIGGEFNPHTIAVNINYIPPTTIDTNELTTTPIEPSITSQGPTNTESSDAALQSSTGDEDGTGAGAWLKWVLVGGALIITIAVVVGCIVMRQKKPPPAESTYANLGKDLNTYQTMPVPAPRTIQKPNGTQKAGAAKPKVALDENYSEPKDSQDMSEAIYADPERFNADSDNYAEPYAKSKTSPQSCTYADPDKTNYAETYASVSEGNYAELSLPNDSKELYARPIPKAQRKQKAKDESNYSNVFGDQYANTTK